MKAAIRYYVRFLPLLFFIYPISKIWEVVLFERSLNASAITFDDFPQGYVDALIAAQLKDEHPDYEWASIEADTPTEQRTIPPIIHFIWFEGLYHDHLDVSRIPVEISHAPDRCREFNSEFTTHIWNETSAHDLIEEHYGWFLDVYDNYRYPIQRVDAFKYFVLWHHGGVYLDLDIACRRALNPLLQFPAWYPKASPLGINNDLMATRARHPLTGLMLRQLSVRDKNWWFPYLTIFWSTGPQFTSDVLRMWLQKDRLHQGRDDPDGVFVLPQEFYSEKYTFFGHSPGGTWHGKDVAIVLWLVQHPWTCFMVFAMLVLLLLRTTRIWLVVQRGRFMKSFGCRRLYVRPRAT